MTGDHSNTVYVVTGGNRGIGLGLVRSLLARNRTSVIATVRNEQAATVLKSEIANADTGEGSILRVVCLDFSKAINSSDAREAFQIGIDHIDVLINNAGFAPPMVPTCEVTPEDLRAAFEVNTIAPLMVFQGLWPLLQKSSSPKLIIVTSSVGSIADMEPFPGGAYGASRAAVNWITKALHQENKDKGLVSIALHPGWVRTRMGQFAADQWGYGKAPPVTVEESVRGMLKVIDEANKETSGKFLTQEGETIGW